MKKSSVALLVSLLALAGAASAQTDNNGILMTHDRDVASKIEQHARDVQAQPAVQNDMDAPAQHVEQKPAHQHHHGHGQGHHHTVKTRAAHSHVEAE
ncbi:hypothetical protein PPMP20_33815 [Paraburkholderia phymatum]|uniref:Putative signal peptide protein n=1 Tax=Paraburkholderia phymatum (strain DSM 17167 / CIP 108236 / LMG 21445 / STM815) TaxID=391038 RepID=B2JMJ6_PARP8|nr:hypothetical protein [Paraburkholderia phymatum]ACC72790.1 putative signal peptide protein [Paraburkholderia phymatum STM815]